MDRLELMVGLLACTGILGFTGSLGFACYCFGYSRGLAATDD